MSRRFFSPHGLIEADRLAQRYGTTPAALLDERDPYRAYCVNAAVMLAGLLSEGTPTEPPPPPPIRRRFIGHAPLLVGTIVREGT